MIVKKFLNFVNEQNSAEPQPTDKKTEKEEFDKDGKPVRYFPNRNPVFWEFEKQLDKFKNYRPQVFDKLQTPNVGGHHKAIIMGEFGNYVTSKYPYLSIRLSSDKNLFKVYLTNPKKVDPNKVADQKEEKEIQDILKECGMTGVGFEWQSRTNTWGFAEIFGRYTTLEQLTKAIEKIGEKFGHFIHFKGGQTLGPEPVAQSPNDAE
jgi:hypothetical protein